MAGMLGRISELFKSKMNAALNAAENPNETLDLSYEQQLEQLQKVRRGIADVVTAKARLQLQLAHLQQDAGRFDGQARQALAANREDLARLALARKAEATQQLQGLQAQVQALETQQEQLEAGEQRLSTKIEAFRTRKETIKAEYTAAQAQVRIGEAASGLSEEMADVNAAIQRAEDKTQAMQARANAIGELTAAGTLPDLLNSSGDDVQAQLDKIAMAGSVEDDLATMKAQLAGAAAPKALAEASEPDGLVVRIQGSGQYRLAPDVAAQLRSLDHRLSDAVHANDAPQVHAILQQMISLVQTQGSSVSQEELVRSEHVLPPPTLSVEEIHAMLHEDSLLAESTV